MSIVVTCECTMTYKLPSRYAGKRCRCRECGRLFKVPKSDELPKASEVIRKTKGTIYVDEDGRTYG